MLINERGNFHKLLQVTGTKFVELAALAAVVGFVAHYFNAEDYLFPSRQVGMLVAAVSFFLAFRINAGYSRWWLARQVWGGLVNESRSLGMYVASMMRRSGTLSEAEQELQRRIVFRHIGFINALRLQLRRQGQADWDREIWNRRINGLPLFCEDDTARLKQAKNVASQIVLLQSQDIAGYFDYSGDYRQVALDAILRELYVRQGQSEAIKNTVLAWGYVAYTKLLARARAVILILSQLNGFSVAGPLLVAFIATVFLTIEQVGRNLDNPFENSFNDTPMSSLCRTIEIDLLQQIGQPCELEPTTPVDGRLD
jgi:putative membrane protein